MKVKRFGTFWLLLVALGLYATPSHARQNQIDINLPAFNYDVLYLTDYIDFATQKLAKSIPDFSGEIINKTNGPVDFWIWAQASIQLTGKGQELLATIASEPISKRLGRPMGAGERLGLSSNDLKGESTGFFEIQNGTAGYVEGPGRKTLEDLINNSGQSTAPVGIYRIEVYAFPLPKGSASSGSPSLSTALGRGGRTITIKNSSPNEVSVTLIDPQPGAAVPTTLPSFSWTSPNSTNTLYVYEKLPTHRSPQEAITGVPYLKKELVGATTLTYPVDASRRLEQNKSYYWFVETNVTTNRGTQTRRSEIQLFRIVLENPLARAVERLLGNLGSNVSGTYATLQSLGWIPNRVTLDGKVLTTDELNALANQLTEQNVKEARAE
ncbi:MAG: hypothetical protein WBD36_04970 [Bacteroidota bacterium]